ncbi:endonuclease domain-containing protein [Streptomyces griseus]|uniref:endonuclease domain-containing protein n=1 Tax=Streptomyces griseus TaxID=1911 RepID=UPI00340FDC74
MAVLVPPEQRCGTYQSPRGWSWPWYVERKMVGSLPKQWETPRMPYWYVWWRLFEIQKGRCACCLEPPSVVDHDHRSGAIRGLLCISCNKLESAYHRRERLCVHESPHCFEHYWRNPPALRLGWEKRGAVLLRSGHGTAFPVPLGG